MEKHVHFVDTLEHTPPTLHGILRTPSSSSTTTSPKTPSPKKHFADEAKKDIIVLETNERQATAQAVHALASEAKKRAERSAFEARHGPIYDSDEKKTLLRLLSMDDAQNLKGHLSTRARRVRKGHVIVRAGDPGTSMYFVEQGECITGNPFPGVVIPAGSFFGERAFLMSLSSEEEKRNTNPIIGAIASLLGSPVTENKPYRISDVIVSSENAVVQELEYQEAADIMWRNADALNFLRSTSTQRMQPSHDKQPHTLILW
jgi:hypothetical protein